MNLRYLLIVFALSACAPRVTPMNGPATPERKLPAIPMLGGHHRISFRWDYEENSLLTHGEGAIRTASPDTARVDLFLVGGIFAGYAVLIGDSLRGPNIDRIRRLLPPPAMLWAAIGRLSVPALPDTVVRASGDTIQAEIGRPATWRVTLHGSRIMQLVRLNGGRIAEAVTRDAGGRLLYEVPGHRKLWLGIIRDDEVPPFDATIFTR
ncbi:MAG TPA: hypothetical protein VM099_00235 [Gemmatimonadaceae bacterium]|nr:hypothetical protein [Gemmatimonadaceae bacterium]